MSKSPTSTLMLVVPMYNCAPQIERTLGQLTPELQARFAEVFVLDNRSTDEGPEVAARCLEKLTHTRGVLAQNDQNYGLGGSQKVCFERCIQQGYDGLVLFHGDDQGQLSDLMNVLHDYDTECVLGARFMRGSSLKGYSAPRIVANILFNGMFSVAARRQLWDLGSGLNFYTREFLERRLWEDCADDLTFNYYLILRTAKSDASFSFAPISWREEDQVTNVKLFAHGKKMLHILKDFSLRKSAFMRSTHNDFEGERTYRILSQ